jgi:sugar phosphate isomerase/epimerase
MGDRATLAIRRRDFLSAAAGAATLLSTPRRLAWGAEDKPARWKMRLSASSINFSRLPIEQACQRIAALGFEGIDIWSAHAGCPHLDDVLKRLGPAGLKELLAKHKLKLYAFSVYVGGYAQYAELLGKAGGGVAIRSSAGPCDPKELTARMKDFLEGLKPEVELAEKHNSYLAIENHGTALLDGLDSFKAFADLNRHPRLGIAMAPYHLQVAKVKVEEAIGAAGKQLLFFYAWQNAAGLGQLPGHGPTDMTPWIAALAKAGYPWYVNPFMHDEPAPDPMATALTKARDYLNECYGKTIAGG